MVCLADQPMDERFSVACYHIDLEPFMSRGRALRAEGKGRAEVDQMRELEITNGTLAMPSQPTTLYVRYGPAGSFDVASGTAEGTQLRYVIYTPFATAESTGLSLNPAPNTPWLMAPGKPWAHIMITPPRN